MPGNRCAALIDEAEERGAEDGEGGQSILAETSPVSQTDTEIVGG